VRPEGLEKIKFLKSLEYLSKLVSSYRFPLIQLRVSALLTPLARCYVFGRKLIFLFYNSLTTINVQRPEKFVAKPQLSLLSNSLATINVQRPEKCVAKPHVSALQLPSNNKCTETGKMCCQTSSLCSSTPWQQ
jgi:hypothetical protein